MAAAALLCALAFAFVALEMTTGGLAAFDSAVAGWVRALVNPRFTRLMLVITDLGSAPFVIGLTALAALCLFARREWGDGLGVAAASLASWQLEIRLKMVFQRPRPELPYLSPATGYSFPSGHAAVTAALFLTLALVFSRHASRAARALALSGAGLLTLLVGISRVSLGVHHPSDVLAGFAAGALVALFISLLLRLDSRAG